MSLNVLKCRKKWDDDHSVPLGRGNTFCTLNKIREIESPSSITCRDQIDREFCIFQCLSCLHLTRS